MSLVLESKAGGDFKPHVEGIYAAVCVDVIELGMMEVEFQGQKRLVNKVRVFFETEQRNEEGKNCVITKTLTASLHPKARLAEFLGKWRGRPVMPGELIDLTKLIGANCTLVISHQQNLMGRTYASIDAISKPTKRVVPSGQYDPALARKRIAEWKAKEGQVASNQSSVSSNRSSGMSNQPAGVSNQAGAERPLNPVAEAFPQSGAGSVAGPKSPAAAQAATEDFDPEVGF